MIKSLSYSLIVTLLGARALRAQNGASASAAIALAPSEVCHTAVLRNGFVLRYARLRTAGPATRVWLCADNGAGYLDVPSEQFDRLEPAEAVLPVVQQTPEPNGKVQSQDSVGGVIAKAAARNQLDADFVTSVVKAESAFDPNAVSSKGAQGLMQLMPRTAAALGLVDAFDPAANLEAGTKYLRHLLDQYAGDAAKALAAYNAGPGRVEHFSGVPPYRETRAYVARVINDYNRRKVASGPPRRVPDGR